MRETRHLHKPFGAAIRRRREAIGASVASLATSSGVDRDEVLRIEAGEGDPELETLIAVARSLKTTVSDLMRDAEAEGDRPKES